MNEYVIKIDIDNTFIYKINDSNKTLENLIDNLGKYLIPTVLYIEKDNDIFYNYGNEALFNIYKEGYISHFLLLLNLSYNDFINDLQLKQFFDNKNIKISEGLNNKCEIKIYNKQYSIKKLLSYFLKNILKLIAEQQNIIHCKIIIPYIYNEQYTSDLYKLYDEITNEIIKEQKNINFDIIKEENLIENKEYIFISINEYNTIIKNSKSYNELNYGLNNVKQELYDIIIHKLKIKNIIIKDKYHIKIKKYIHLNFYNILSLIKTKNFNCILELDEIYNVNISKNDLYNFIKNIKINIDETLKNILYDKYSNITFYSYNSNFEIFDLINDNLCKGENNFLNYCFYVFDKIKLFNKKDIHDCKEIDDIQKIPFTLGIDTENGMMVRFINKNTCIPYSKNKIFLYKIDNDNENDSDQTEIKLSIYKGNNLYSKYNELLKQVSLNFKNKNKDKELKIKITFHIDNLKFLNILVENTMTNEEFSINNIVINKNIEEDDTELSDEEFQSIEI
jgi:hypothetical protein